MTVDSAASFVKHPGPKVMHMTRITPNDVAHLPDRVGKMVFDRSQMKWVRAPDASGGTHSAHDSEDPFRDIESLRGDDSRKAFASDEEGESGNGYADLSAVSMDLDHSRLEGGGGSDQEDQEEEEHEE